MPMGQTVISFDFPLSPQNNPPPPPPPTQQQQTKTTTKKTERERFTACDVFGVCVCVLLLLVLDRILLLLVEL